MPPSLREFSRLAGVSPSTVSRVFSGTGRVSPETQQRILELAEDLGFRPSAIGTAAFGGKTRSVGVVLPSLEVSYFAQIAKGIQDTLLPIDYLPMLMQVDPGTPDSHAIQRLLDHRVDAMILNIGDESLRPDDFGTVLRARLPLVLLGAVQAGLAQDSVENDDMGGSRAMGEHLLALGHKRFGFCYFGAGHSSADRRLAGFRDALNSAGIALREESILRFAHDRPEREAEAIFCDELEKLLQRKDRPTAIFASTDRLAIRVYQVARNLRLRIPGDISIAGFANLSFTALIEPPLTTVDQHGYEIGRRAAEMVISRLEQPDLPPRTEVVPTTLIARKSTDAPLC